MKEIIDRDLPLKKTIAQNIQKLRKERNWTQKKLAEESSISTSTLSDYLNSRTLINPGNVEKLAIALDVKKSDIDPTFESAAPIKYLTSVDFVKIPVLGNIACGDPILAEQNIESYTYESADTLPSGTLFALIAKGDSMSPTIPNGATVLIREQSDVENGEIAAVLVNGDTEATLKRVKRIGSMIMLMPDNNKHDPIPVTKETPARIIGKAVRVNINL